MTEVERIIEEYDHVMQGSSAWHGDPLWQILDGVSAECAAHLNARHIGLSPRRIASGKSSCI